MTYEELILSHTPTLYWRLGTSGITDQSGNGRNGTGVGSIAIGAITAGPLGGSATDFDGVDDSITSTYAPYAVGSSRTFEAWVKRDADTGTDVIFAVSGGAGANVRGYINPDESVVFEPAQGSASATWAAGTYPAGGAWVHFVITFNDATDTAELFLNGVSQGTKTVATPYANTTGGFRLSWPTADGLDGKMAGVAVHESILSAARILAHASAASFIEYEQEVLSDNPALYWSLSGANDYSGNGRNGAGVGSITIGGVTGALTDDADAATEFSGTGQRITTTYLPFATGRTTTVEGWAWRDVNTQFHHLFGDAGSPNYSLRVDQNNSTVTLIANSGSSEVGNWVAAWPGTAQWVHWAIVLNEVANTVELFINGVSKGVLSGSITVPALTGWRLGDRADASTLPWDGRMDEVAIYERALTQAEIEAHYDLGVNGPVSVGGGLLLGVG